MSMLQYKEYQGSVTFEDGGLLIQILHIDDCITTTCDSASGAQAAFEELVDDYVDTCAAVGKEPSKPFKGSFNVRIGSLLHKNAALAASEVGETLNAWIAGAVESRLRRDNVLKLIKGVSFTEAWLTSTAKLAHNRFVAISPSNAAQQRFVGDIEGCQANAAIAKARQMAEMTPTVIRWNAASEQLN